MEPVREPLTKRERQELGSYVGWAPVVGRLALFLLVVSVIGALSRFVFGQLALLSGFFAGPGWWVASVLVGGVWLYQRSIRWTGGRALARAIQADLAGGEAVVHRFEVTEAIEFEEREDEGPTFVVAVTTGEVLRFCGQEMVRPKRQGFPWAEIQVRETPVARRFLGLSGDRSSQVAPTRRPPPTAEEAKTLDLAGPLWARVDVEFENLKAAAQP